MTTIEWTEETWNPIRARNKATAGVGHFCVKVGEECRNCYAEAMQPRFKNVIRFAAQDAALVEMFIDDDVLKQPLRWKRGRQIFPCSMTDLFGEFVPDEWIDKVLAVAALSPQHIYQVLTKRADRMLAYFDSRAKSISFWENAARAIGYTLQFEGVDRKTHGLCKFPLPNWRQGVSVGLQKTVDDRIPKLLRANVAFRWISAEPLLEPIDISPYVIPDLRIGPKAEPRLDWVVCGLESGRRARPGNIDMLRKVRDQCQAAGVPVFVKQLGAKPRDIDGNALNLQDTKGGDMAEWPDDLRVREPAT